MVRNTGREVKYRNRQMEELIDDYIHSERDRAIMRRKLIDDIGYERLGQEFGLTSVQIRRIVKKHKEELFTYI